MIVVAIATVHCMICSTEEKLKRNRTLIIILPTPLGTTITHTLPLSHPHPPTITPSHYHTLSSTAPQLPISSVHSLTVSHGVLSYWMPVTSLTTPSTPPSLSSTQPLSIQYLNITAHTSTPVYVARLPSEDYGECVCVCDGIVILLL